MLDQQFRDGRAKLVRELADKADPWIKSRLLKLAGRYECDESPADAPQPADRITVD